jgi:hypothetical protein
MDISFSNIVVRLREDLNSVLPNDIKAAVTASESVDRRSITISITGWSSRHTMISKEHLASERNAVIRRLKTEMDPTLRLSPEALMLISKVEGLISKYQLTTKVGGVEIRNFIGDVMIEPRALKTEREMVIQDLKRNRQISLFGV